MVADDLLETLDDVLGKQKLGSLPGEVFTTPVLDVLRYYARPITLSKWPVVGRGLSVVAVVRQPIDTPPNAAYAGLVPRIASAAHGRFPPWPKGHGLSLALTAIVCTDEPIRPADDEALTEALGPSGSVRSRVVPMALFRINLAQEAMAMAVAGGPGDLFPELDALTEFLTGRFQRFVPLLGSS